MLSARPCSSISLPASVNGITQVLASVLEIDGLASMEMESWLKYFCSNTKTESFTAAKFENGLKNNISQVAGRSKKRGSKNIPSG